MSLDKTATAKTNGAFLFSMFATLDLWPIVGLVAALRAKKFPRSQVQLLFSSFDSALLLVCVMN